MNAQKYEATDSAGPSIFLPVSRPGYIGLCALLTASVLPGLLEVLIIGALTRGPNVGGAGLGASSAGAVAAAGLLGVAIGSVSLAGRLGTRLAVPALLAAAALQAACGLQTSAPAFAIFQFLAGALAGAAASSGAAAAAQTRSPQRTTGTLVVASNFLIGIVIIVVSNMLGAPSPLRLFTTIGVMMAALASLAALAPRTYPRPAPISAKARSTQITFFMLLASAFFLTASDGGLYAFFAPIAAKHGFGPELAGILTGVGTMLGVIAALGVTLLHRNRLIAALIGLLLLKAIGSIALPYLSSLTEFSIGLLLSSVTFFTLYAGMSGLAAAEDVSGRLAGRLFGVFYFGSAAGPLVSGEIAEAKGLDVMCVVMGVGIAISLALFCSARRGLITSPARA